MIKKILLFILPLFLVSGCVQKEILDDIAIEMARAYDYEGEGKTLGTSLVYNVEPDKSVQNTTFSSTATSSRDLANKLQKQSSDPISEGSLEVMLFSKEIASKGLEHYLDAPQRNASIGARLFLAVVDGKAQDLLTGDFGYRGNAIYISNLLTHNIEHEDLPKTNLQLFFHDYYQRGKSAYMPQLKKISDGSIELNGISFFKDDHINMVHSIDADDMFFFKILVDQYSQGTHTIKLGKNEGVLRSITTKHKMKLTNRNPFEVTIHLNVRGVLREYTGRNNLSGKELTKFEKKLEVETTEKCEAMIKKFQEKKIDPVGFGFFIKTKTRGYDINDWVDGDDYQSLTVKVKTNVQIIESGVIE